MQLDAILVNSGAKFRKEILAMPVVALEKTLKHMTIRKGVRGEETVGGYDSDAEVRPYKTGKNATDTGSVEGRTLITYLGDVVEEFDPYILFSTVYGEKFSSLVDRKESEVVKTMALAVAKRVSSKLGKALFAAVRDKDGTSTTDLFNGFDTIAAKEISEGNITVAKGNLHIHEAITAANAGDVLKAIYSAASDELRDRAEEGTPLKMFVPKGVLDYYEEWCLSTLGAVVYNQTYKKSHLHCDSNVEIVPLVGLKNSEYIYLTTKENMLVGMDQLSDEEKVKIRECDNPKALQFFMCMYWGVQFESIRKEFLLVSRTTAAPSPTPTPSGSVIGVNEIEFAATAGNCTETFATTTGKPVAASVETEGADDWLEVENVSDNQIKFTVTAYAKTDTGDDPRVAKVKISAIDESGSLEVTVEQAKAES